MPSEPTAALFYLAQDLRDRAVGVALDRTGVEPHPRRLETGCHPGVHRWPGTRLHQAPAGSKRARYRQAQVSDNNRHTVHQCAWDRLGCFDESCAR